jgi:hypothetical protein
MSKEVVEEKAVEAVEAQASGEEKEGPRVQAVLNIRVLENGAIDLHSPEDYHVLSQEEMEAVARQVYEQLRDMRVASLAVQMFKQRLG